MRHLVAADLSVGRPTVPIMTSAWNRVRDAIDAGAFHSVANLLIGYDDIQRREVARELPGHLRGSTAGERWIESMRVAGAGALAGSAAVAAWLNRRELILPLADDIPPILRVVAVRPPAWQEDLAVRMALRLRGARFWGEDRRVRLALALLRETGAEPPEHDPLTLAWIASAGGDLAADPLLDVMVPRLFEAEGVGGTLRNDRRLPDALVTLAADGRIKRATLLDGCRTRFLRGGQAADLRFFVRLHDLLDPAPEEAAPHAGDYVALLSHAPADVAGLALRQLRRMKVTPPAEAIEGLLYRSEGKLVRAGLSLLDRVLKGPDGDHDAYAPALAAALLCESGDADTRAAKLVRAHAGRFGPAAIETIKDTLALLPSGDVALDEEEPAPFVPVPLPPVPRAARMTPPPGNAWRLARSEPAEDDWAGSERWLDGFVRLMADGRAELTAELAPLAARYDDRSPWWRVADWAAAMAKELREPGTTPSRRLPDVLGSSLWKAMRLGRFAEVHQAQVAGRLPPYLLAMPSRDNGLLEAGELVERLEGYERDGVTALPLDLRQALLRLSRTVTPEVTARAARLTGEAGRTVHRWLTDREVEPPAVPDAHDESFEHLLTVFAGNRELAAARWAPAHGPSWRDLQLLTLAHGPGGPGVALVLAYALVEGDGVRPLLFVAAAGDLPGAELGRRLAALLRDGRGGAGPAVTALRAAAEQGAHREVWQVLTGLLPAYLPGPGERATSAHTRVVGLAAEIAEWADARGELPVVAELADRPGTSELVRQARRLHARLSAG
ncbi:DUF6493 family protein [Nonomuraea solani]|nr:DUF6493 family protein [Nonomuraea solani]